MTVYVDELRFTPRSKRWRYEQSCHLMAGTLEELHAFAAKLGLRRGWFQASYRWPHYDLTANKRAEAVRAGAVEMRSRELVKQFMVRP